MAAITTGDRLADFSRPNRAGELIHLYKHYCAQPLAIAVFQPEVDQASAVQLLKSMKVHAASHSDVLLLISDAQSANLDWPLDDQTVIIDDGQYAAYLRHEQTLPETDGSDSSNAALLLLVNSNMHVTERGIWSIDSCQQIQSEISRVHTESDPMLEAFNHAPVLIIPDVLDTDMCEELIERYKSENEASGILTQSGDEQIYAPDDSVKIRREHRLQPGDLMNRLEICIARRVLPEIRWFSWFNVTRYEGMKVVAYAADDKGYFRVHRDNDGSDTQHRRFAMTLNLNTSEYTGGGLSFPEFTERRYQATAGSAVLFSCNLAHQVDPVSEGVRYALVSFFYGEGQQITTPVPGQ